MILVSDDSRLERWLIRCKNSIEKVKKTLDLYYTLKTKVPEIMTGWDTKGDWFKSISSVLWVSISYAVLYFWIVSYKCLEYQAIFCVEYMVCASWWVEITKFHIYKDIHHINSSRISSTQAHAVHSETLIGTQIIQLITSVYHTFLSQFNAVSFHIFCIERVIKTLKNISDCLLT